MSAFFTKLLGASWKTTVWGAITMGSLFITQQPDLVSAILPANITKTVFSIAALISGLVTFYNTKDKNVHGGTVDSVTGNTIPPSK